MKSGSEPVLLRVEAEAQGFAGSGATEPGATEPSRGFAGSFGGDISSPRAGRSVGPVGSGAAAGLRARSANSATSGEEAIMTPEGKTQGKWRRRVSVGSLAERLVLLT